MTCFAEANINKNFDGYTFIHDNPETGRALVNPHRYFGEKCAKRIKPPAGTVAKPKYSSTLEEFYDNATNAMDAGPCIYVLDSMDAILTKEEDEKFEEDKNLRNSGKGGKGTFGTSKAKQNSTKLRILNNKIHKTGSILIIISQTRQNIGFGSQFTPKTRGGGEALKFYARIEIWLSLKEYLMKRWNKKDRKIGRITKAKIVKNHYNGWEGEVEIPIYRSIGIDDMGGCIRYLVDEGVWKESAKVINASTFDVKMKEPELIKFIESRELQSKMLKLVSKTWHEIEKACKVKRVSKYQ